MIGNVEADDVADAPDLSACNAMGGTMSSIDLETDEAVTLPLDKACRDGTMPPKFTMVGE